MKIVIFGANGQTGRVPTDEALAAGRDVAAVTRRPAEFPITHHRLTVVEADVHDAPAVDRAVEGADAVLSALGVPFTASRSLSTATASVTSSLQSPIVGSPAANAKRAPRRPASVGGSQAQIIRLCTQASGMPSGAGGRAIR
jgi:putative NADH-flavin reductase